MITITFKAKTLELEIKGHAGQGNKGEDIVCAAISTLFCTLCQALIESRNMLKANPVIKDKDGDGYIQCKPKKEFEGNIARTYWTILVGIQGVADENKDFVKFSIE